MSNMTGSTVRCDKPQPLTVRIGKPGVAHGAQIHRLVTTCKPLDLNSRYAYLLLCEHFAETCTLAQVGARVVGFVSAYKPPQREDTLFVWQVAVAADLRGKRLAASMLRELVARPHLRSCRYVETTVTASNTASRRLFHGLARRLGAPLEESVLFARSAFGEEAHEAEMLIRIGPFAGKQTGGNRP